MGNSEKDMKPEYKNRKRKKKEYRFAFRIGELSDFKKIKQQMKKDENRERLHR